MPPPSQPQTPPIESDTFIDLLNEQLNAIIQPYVDIANDQKRDEKDFLRKTFLRKFQIKSTVTFSLSIPTMREIIRNPIHGFLDAKYRV